MHKYRVQSHPLSEGTPALKSQQEDTDLDTREEKRGLLCNLSPVGNDHGVLLVGITDYIKGKTANKMHEWSLCYLTLIFP